MLKANFNTMPFITNENKPNDNSVIGKEKNSITGFTITFRHPNIIVSTIKDAKEPIIIL